MAFSEDPQKRGVDLGRVRRGYADAVTFIRAQFRATTLDEMGFHAALRERLREIKGEESARDPGEQAKTGGAIEELDARVATVEAALDEYIEYLSDAS